MNNVAIITARGGSKRIPRKNIKPFLGQPIIAYSIEKAINSKLFQSVIVSTDDREIAAIALQYGAEVPFLRSAENSDDFAGTAEVLIEVVSELQKIGLTYDHLCCIYPTAPLIKVEYLIEGYRLMRQHDYDSVFPVSKFGFPIQRALKIGADGKVDMIWPENRAKRSQDLPAAYHDAGQFYWLKTAALLADKKLYTDHSGAIVLDEMECQDIDTEIDWQLAELKFQLLFNN